MKFDAIEVRFGELWLKGSNRGMFLSMLRDNVSRAVNGKASVKPERDRFLVLPKGSRDYEPVLEALRYVPGISWFSPVVVSKPSIRDMMRKAESIGSGMTLRLEVKRSFKGHEFDSQDVVRSMIKGSQDGSLKLKLDKDSQDVLHISVMKDSATLHVNKLQGVGGLPVGSSGKAVVLLSGGIDSPVAAYYAMKRGLLPVYVHFHTFPDNAQAMRSKIPKMVGLLARYSGGAKAYYMPAHLFQAAAMKIPSRYELVVYKRFIYKVAEKVAKLEGASVIVTGESIGQVASQTVANLQASQHGIKTLIIRPLSGFDKQEIVSKAIEIGTYGLSIQEYRDVCSIKIKRPATRMNSELTARLYNSCGLTPVVTRTVKESSQNAA